MARLLTKTCLTLALVGLSACSPDEAAPVSPGVTRQAVVFPTAPDGGGLVKGQTLLAHLGRSIARCPASGYVAGAPGDFSAWLSPVRLRLGADHLLSGDPYPVGCEGNATSLNRGLVGGPDFATTLFMDGGTSRLASFRVDAFGPPPTSLQPFALATSNGVRLYAPGAPTPLGVPSSTLNSSGTALAWTGSTLAVGEPAQTQVSLFGITAADGGFTASSFNVIDDPNAMGPSDFGRVVVVGNVTPHAGEELIVAAPAVGRVYIFSGTSLVMTLDAGVTNFGAALSVDPRVFGGGLHALWVGDPNNEQVHRFVGTSETLFTAPPGLNAGAHFGAAVSVDSQGLVAVGAPDYDDSLLGLGVGLVVEANVNSLVLTGAAMNCDAGTTCRLPSGCAVGTCVGDVFCEKQPDASFCLAGEVCSAVMNACVVSGDAGADAGADAGSAAGTDAGADAGPDAGADAGVDAGVDAGAETGAGSDAGSDGSADAGDVTDAGVTVFHTSCGCTSGGLPLLLLGLLMARRRG